MNVASTGPPHNSTNDCSPRAARIGLLAIVIAAGAIRVATALLMPVISRDGVLYCWQARDLGAQGVELLRSRIYEQHPLFAASILAAQRAARAFGVEDSALAWQRAAQCVTLSSGLTVVVLTYLLTLRLAESLSPQVPRRVSALTAAAFAGLLPLNVWLSADVMSEQLFLVFYLSALLAAANAPRIRAAGSAGLLSGVAFLARPEGVVPLLAAGVMVLRGGASSKRRAIGIAALAISFAVVAGPYVLANGRFSPKLAKEAVAVMADRPAPARQMAALVRESVPWFVALPRAAYETIRGGRVLLPLLAIIGLWAVRRDLSAALPALLLWAAAGQLMLGALLLWRHGYLDPRHMITVIMALTPFAGVAPFVVFPVRSRASSETSAIDISRLARTGMVAAVLVVFAGYLPRIPNANEAHLRDAATWLRSNGAVGRDALLLGGSSERRIAFYAEMRFQPWPENIPDEAVRTRAFLDHVSHFRPTAAAFEIASDAAQLELRGNAALLDAVQRDSVLGKALLNQQEYYASRGRSLHLLQFDFMGAAQQE
ncbi:MAG: hypothetical protein JNG88_07105 [Phycisphaerales bacterium]|nr:hypothetical protein [Phycisphaerales bacterium]